MFWGGVYSKVMFAPFEAFPVATTKGMNGL